MVNIVNNIFSEKEFMDFINKLKSKEFIETIKTKTNLSDLNIEIKLNNYLYEGLFGLSILKEYDLLNKRVLEIGAGIGVLSAWLYINGINIIPLEPGLGSNFNMNLMIMKAIWSNLNLDTNNIIEKSAADLNQMENGFFDFIFSINVLEHVDDIDKTFAALKSVLSKDGILLNHCPNYFFPYEPHYKIFLFPFFPNLTGRIYGYFKEPAWQSINFISFNKIKKIAKKIGLIIIFKKSVITESFERFNIDKEYKRRQKKLYIVYKIMKYFGIIKFLNLIPSYLLSPIRFECKHNNEKNTF